MWQFAASALRLFWEPLVISQILFSNTHQDSLLNIFSSTMRPITPTKTSPLKDYWSKQGFWWNVCGHKCWSIPAYRACQNTILEGCRWMPVNCIFCKPLEVNPLHHSLHGRSQHGVAMTPHRLCHLIGWLSAWMLPL